MEWDALRLEARDLRCLLRIPSAALRLPWLVLRTDPALPVPSSLDVTAALLATDSSRELSCAASTSL